MEEFYFIYKTVVPQAEKTTTLRLQIFNMILLETQHKDTLGIK